MSSMEQTATMEMGEGDFGSEFGQTAEMSAGTYPEGWETLDSHIRNAHGPQRMSEEERFAKKVEARRQFELERRQRIFDAKRRTIGVDKQMLDQQVIEKRLRNEAEQAEIRADDGTMARCDKLLKLAEIEKQRIRRNMEKHCKDYSMQNLNFESRREYDINDPLYVRKGVPSRIGDDDPRCGPSSMQQFGGEDVLREERTRQQKAQMVNFIEQQKFEKSMMSGQDAIDDANMAREYADMTELRDQLDDEAGRIRKKTAVDLRNDNLKQAQENIDARQRGQEEEEEKNAREIEFNLTNPFMTETGVKYKKTGGVVRDSYKGSTREEREQVAAIQRDQCIENNQMRGANANEEWQHASEANAVRKHLVASERQKQQNRRKLAQQVAQENLRAAAVQNQKTKGYNELYTNKFSPEFFEQFGTTTR
eukprot:TRINITY_DN25936_c0_g1_i1.p1 TRINITY_DN25936_c0_g1~~TRINITY_DN25936_c0_g1_i1.p1  ORF type:complete len:422 (-),score=103.66 TRINITY_DN25936_c0_g1_i1:151-1416(-)